MLNWNSPDWEALLTMKLPIAEIFVRGTVIYLVLCVLLRVVLKRQTGQVSASDMLVIMLVTGVCRNPLVADAYSLPDGITVVGVVMGWSYLVDWLCFHSRTVHNLLHAAPVQLIARGRILEDRLRKELMTHDRLKSKLRQKGVKDLAEVDEAWLECNGEVSVIRRCEPSLK